VTLRTLYYLVILVIVTLLLTSMLACVGLDVPPSSMSGM